MSGVCTTLNSVDRFNQTKLHQLIEEKVTFETFIERARLNLKTSLRKGVICGYDVEEIENPLTKKVRYLDKRVDELEQGKKIEKILRQ